MSNSSLFFENSALHDDTLYKADPRSKKKTPPEQLEIQLDFAKISHRCSEHVLFSPMHYEPGYAYPLLIWMHGPGSDERQIMKTMPLISMRNFVAIAPRGISWTPEPRESDEMIFRTARQKELAQNAIPELVLRLDQEKEKKQAKSRKNAFYDWPQTDEGISHAEQKIFDCISYAQEKCNIAENRIFLVGFGSGGTMSYRIAMQYPQAFAGVISIGGRFPEGNLPLRLWNSVRNLPTMLALGNQSTIFSPEDAKADLKLFHTAGLSVSVRQYPCGQELVPQMLQDVNRWVMERVCGG